jgi:uncharacterized protein YjiS (DUF1127 family)
MELFRVLNVNLFEPWLRARRRKRDLCRLRSLDDRLLADVGLRRSDVEAVLYGQMPLDQLRRQDERAAVRAAAAVTTAAARAPVGRPDRAAWDRAA